MANTSDANASGNRVNESRDHAMPTRTTARNTATISTTIRCPPRIRSTNGPTNGATTANGAMLTARNKITFVRAASGLIDKNKESASATVMAVSPATISECVFDKRPKGVATGNPPFSRYAPVRRLTTTRFYAVRCLSYLYPSPRMVTIRVGLAGSSSILERKRLIWTSSVFVSPT